jgi:hypothetical protein
VLARYVREVLLRCSLIMSIFGRSHSADCAVDEHHRVIAPATCYADHAKLGAIGRMGGNEHAGTLDYFD